MKNLCKWNVEDYATLSTKAEKVQIMHHITIGLPKGTQEQQNTCKGCTLGKFAKATFNDLDSRVLAILERIHYDVCGSFSTTSTSKHMCYIIFVDDFSWKCWILFIQKKYHTFSKFVEFKALVEKETGMKVKALKSDNGGEYVSNKFKFLCAKEYIRRDLTTPHNPQ